MKTVFIDGSAGTTGLRIRERLSERRDITLLTLPESERKDPAARKRALNGADVAFLCLPDDAAREAITMIENPNVAIIDTSTAHRTAEGWTYGFPELFGQRDKIAASKRIANPGCHASGFIALVAPLVRAGLLSESVLLTAFSLTGYSGGGKKMIGEYEDPARPKAFDAPRQYGLSQTHKHLPEMKVVCGLDRAPVFSPILGDYYAGMEVTVPLFAEMLRGTRADVVDAYREAYQNGLVRYNPEMGEGGLLCGEGFSGRDDMEVGVLGNEERLILVARYDNLGKGASGAAIQNMNILLGADEATGLVIGEQ